MERYTTEVKIDGLDLLDVQKFIDDKKRKFIAITLSEIESNLEHKEFMIARKAVLDGFNDYTRSLMRVLFGEIE